MFSVSFVTGGDLLFEEERFVEVEVETLLALEKHGIS